MPVTFVKQKGKIVGMNMTFAEMRVSYKILTGKKIENDDFQGAGKEVMGKFTEKQIRDAVNSFNHEEYMKGDY